MAAYDRDATVSALKALYEIVMLMADVSPTQLNTPSTGWAPPAGTRKSAAVIDLMAHLPYCNDVHLAPYTSAINYSFPDWMDGTFIWFDPYGITAARYPVEDGGGIADITEDEIALTMQNDSCGIIVVLDTKSGTARVIADTSSSRICHTHERGRCPPLCRHQAGVSSRPILELLQEWRQKFRDLNLMVDVWGAPDVVAAESLDEERSEQMRRLYREHGWPDESRASDCQIALCGARFDDDDDEDDEDDLMATEAMKGPRPAFIPGSDLAHGPKCPSVADR